MKLIHYLLPTQCLVCNADCSDSVCHRCFPQKLDYSLKRCLCCFRANKLFGESGVCLRCWMKPGIIQKRRFLWNYGAVARDFINTLKYRPSRKLCKIAGKLLNQELENLFPHDNWNYKLAVPSDRRMLQKRGFNQVDLLAKYLPGEDLFGRVKHLGYRSSQASLRYNERIQNVQGIFKFQGKLAGGKILLIDDMVTTGATVESLSEELIRAGAESIYLLSLSSKY